LILGFLTNKYIFTINKTIPKNTTKMNPNLNEITMQLVIEQKESFRLLWIIGSGIVTSLIAVIGILFKLYLDSSNRSHSNEKETIRVLGDFSKGIEVLNDTIKETNNIARKTLEKLNNPIIPTLENLTKKD
jgi:beta-lactamase regulating signal transducer with metallopeptidase domain